MTMVVNQYIYVDDTLLHSPAIVPGVFCRKGERWRWTSI